MASSLLSTLFIWHCVLLQANATQPAASTQRNIVDIVGKPSVFAIRPENVQERLASLAPLHETVKTDVLRRYVGYNTDKGIAWVMVDFEPPSNDRQQWALLQMQICIGESGSIRNALQSDLARKLGHPLIKGDRVYWDLHEHKEISLTSGAFDAPEGGTPVHGLMITAAVLQGEAE